MMECSSLCALPVSLFASYAIRVTAVNHNGHHHHRPLFVVNDDIPKVSMEEGKELL